MEGNFVALRPRLLRCVKEGNSCVIVSSAAIAAGVHMLGLGQRPEDLPGKQACAAAGQPELMRMYATAFKRHGIKVAQLLLTHDDIDSRMRRQNASNTIERIFQTRNIVPVINENDTVAVEELRFGDNDRLSAEVAQLVNANLLLLVTSSDGLIDSHGRRITKARGGLGSLATCPPRQRGNVGRWNANKASSRGFRAIAWDYYVYCRRSQNRSESPRRSTEKTLARSSSRHRDVRTSRCGPRAYDEPPSGGHRQEHLYRARPPEGLLHHPRFRRLCDR